MSSKSFRFNEEDDKKIEMLKKKLVIGSDIDVIRFCLTMVHTFKNFSDPSDERGGAKEIKKVLINGVLVTPQVKPNYVPKRKYTDEEIEKFIKHNDKGSFYDFCPFHEYKYLGQCECIDNIEVLTAKMKQIYA